MTTPTIPRLHDQLRAAERAATGPRQHVATLETALQAAVADNRFGDAERLKAELDSARETAAITDAQVTAFRDAADRLDQQRAQENRAADETRQHAQAEQDLTEAMATESRAAAARDSAIAAMWQAVTAARQSFGDAQASEESVNAARLRAKDARRRRGDWPSHHPGPTVARANQTSVLAEHNPVVRAINGWRG